MLLPNALSFLLPSPRGSSKFCASVIPVTASPPVTQQPRVCRGKLTWESQAQLGVKAGCYWAPQEGEVKMHLERVTLQVPRAGSPICQPACSCSKVEVEGKRNLSSSPLLSPRISLLPTVRMGEDVSCSLSERTAKH